MKWLVPDFEKETIPTMVHHRLKGLGYVLVAYCAVCDKEREVKDWVDLELGGADVVLSCGHWFTTKRELKGV